jgi:hypothetical protein
MHRSAVHCVPSRDLEGGGEVLSRGRERVRKKEHKSRRVVSVALATSPGFTTARRRPARQEEQRDGWKALVWLRWRHAPYFGSRWTFLRKLEVTFMPRLWAKQQTES